MFSSAVDNVVLGFRKLVENCSHRRGDDGGIQTIKGVSFRRKCGAALVREKNRVNDVDWPLYRVLKLTFQVLALRQNEWFFVFRI